MSQQVIDEKEWHAVTCFPVAYLTPEEAVAAGIPAVPKAERYCVTAEANLTFAELHSVLAAADRPKAKMAEAQA